MKIPSVLRQSASSQETAMTPMIDVVFLLLIFFIVASARQTREAVLPADLPPGNVSVAHMAPTEIPPDKALIELQRRNNSTLAVMNDTVYEDLAALEKQLRALAAVAPEIPVVLDVGDEVPLGDVVRVYDLCQRLQFHTLKFAIDALPQKTVAPDAT